MLDQNTKKLLPALMQDAMDALSKNTDAPDEMTLPIVLAVAAMPAQALHDIECLKWPKAELSEYFMVLAPSGAKKTALMNQVCEGVRRFEKEQRPQAELDETAYAIEMKRYKANIDAEVKTPAGPNGSPIIKPEKPRGSRYLIGKATSNGLLNTLESVPFAAILSSDAGELFNSHAFQDSSKSMEFISMLSKLWSGESVDRVTGINENNLILDNRRLSMLVMLQQQLAGMLNNSQFKDQGVTNRILITQCEDSFGKKADFSTQGQAETDKNNSRLLPFNDHIYKLLRQVDSNQASGKSNLVERLHAAMGMSKKNEVVLSCLRFSLSDNSRMLMQDFYNRILDMTKEKKYEEYSNFLARAYEHGCRLAGILTIFEEKTEVSEQEVRCAIGLMDYFLEQRMNLTVDGNLKVSAVVECADALWKALQKIDKTDFSKSEICNLCFPYKQMEIGMREKVIDQLQADDKITLVEVESLGRKPKHIIRKSE